MLSDFTLLYLHGFLSSPKSSKARQALAYAQQLGVEDSLLVPFLDQGPAATITSLTELLSTRDTRRLGIIGSSLGGFYATVLAERFNAPAVLINPAIDPWQYWSGYVGEHKNFHTGQLHTVAAEHVDELRALHSGEIADASKYLVFLQRNDEVLDANVALHRFGERHCVLREDGDHSYARFDEELPVAFEFLLSRIGAKVR